MLDRYFPKVPKRALLLIAGLVWMAAGFNILRLGAPDFLSGWNGQALYLLGSAAVFFVFMRFIFYRLVQKHNARILGMGEDKVPVYRFFDRKSYLIMIFMMTGGLLLRSSGLVPPIVIGVLYCGIGSSLLGAGVLFLQKFLRAMRPAKAETPAAAEEALASD